MKTFFLVLLTIINFNSIAQTISAKPIYKDGPEIREMNESGGIIFLYQDSDYQTIVKTISFSVNSKAKAIDIIDKALFMLDMEKTEKDQDISDMIEKVQLKRYGFSQKTIYISSENKNAIGLDKKRLLKIKNALETYSYRYEVNK